MLRLLIDKAAKIIPATRILLAIPAPTSPESTPVVLLIHDRSNRTNEASLHFFHFANIISKFYQSKGTSTRQKTNMPLI